MRMVVHSRSVEGARVLGVEDEDAASAGALRRILAFVSEHLTLAWASTEASLDTSYTSMKCVLCVGMCGACVWSIW